MELLLNNIGKIREATIIINGITVVAGENNTGKSTIGKALFSFFNSFFEIDKGIKRKRVSNIEFVIRNYAYSNFEDADNYDFVKDVSKRIIDNAELFKDNGDKIVEIMAEYLPRSVSIAANSEIVKKIIERLNVSDDDIIKSLLNNNLQDEFNNQVNYLYDERKGNISLRIKGDTCLVTVGDNKVIKLENPFKLGTEAVYIDDPFVLDEIPAESIVSRFYRQRNSHRNHLKTKLFEFHDNSDIVEEVIVNDKLKKILDMIDSFCKGFIFRDSPKKYGYKEKGGNKSLDIRNLSTGLKTFVIVKTLLTNGTIEENGTIIFDEPEIHLHPEWQLLLAEIIVLLQQEFNLHILMTTHSPYFLRAIQVFSEKYDINHKCNYYSAELNKDNLVEMVDVTDDIEKIYYKLAMPLQRLESERWKND